MKPNRKSVIDYPVNNARRISEWESEAPTARRANVQTANADYGICFVVRDDRADVALARQEAEAAREIAQHTTGPAARRADDEAERAERHAREVEGRSKVTWYYVAADGERRTPHVVVAKATDVCVTYLRGPVTGALACLAGVSA